MLRFTRLAVFACAATLALGACSSSGSDAESPNPSRTSGGSDTPTELRLGAVVDISTWVAADATWGNEATYYNAVYDTRAA